MTETMRTWIYVGAAAFSLLVAGVTSRPVGTSPAEFKEVGQCFFPDFTDASAAKSLQVVSYNPDTAEAKIFGVEQGSIVHQEMVVDRLSHGSPLVMRRSPAVLLKFCHLGRARWHHASSEVDPPEPRRVINL